MTETESKQRPDACRYQTYEEEIRLIDLLRIIWKRKWLIAFGTLICTIASAAISLQAPKMYEVSAIIEPVTIDSAKDINWKLAENIYGRKIEEALKRETGVYFESASMPNTNAIKITSRWREEETNLGVEATGRLIRILSEEYEESVSLLKSDINRQIERKLKEMKRVRDVALLTDAILSDIRERQNNLTKELEEVRRNNEGVEEQRESLLKDNTGSTTTFAFLYSMAMNQSISYRGALDRQSYDLKVKAKELAIRKENRMMNIDDILGEIDALNKKREMIRNILVIKEPAASPNPVKSRTMAIVLSVGFAALLAFVFLAFFIEYVKKE